MLVRPVRESPAGRSRVQDFKLSHLPWGKGLGVRGFASTMGSDSTPEVTHLPVFGQPLPNGARETRDRVRLLYCERSKPRADHHDVGNQRRFRCFSPCLAREGSADRGRLRACAGWARGVRCRSAGCVAARYLRSSGSRHRRGIFRRTGEIGVCGRVPGRARDQPGWHGRPQGSRVSTIWSLARSRHRFARGFPRRAIFDRDRGGFPPGCKALAPGSEGTTGSSGGPVDLAIVPQRGVSARPVRTCSRTHGVARVPHVPQANRKRISAAVCTSSRSTHSSLV